MEPVDYRVGVAVTNNPEWVINGHQAIVDRGSECLEYTQTLQFNGTARYKFRGEGIIVSSPGAAGLALFTIDDRFDAAVSVNTTSNGQGCSVVAEFNDLDPEVNHELVVRVPDGQFEISAAQIVFPGLGLAPESATASESSTASRTDAPLESMTPNLPGLSVGPSPTTPPSSAPTSGHSVGVIVASVLVPLIITAVAALVFYILRRRSRAGRPHAMDLHDSLQPAPPAVVEKPALIALKGPSPEPDPYPLPGESKRTVLSAESERVKHIYVPTRRAGRPANDVLAGLSHDTSAGPSRFPGARTIVSIPTTTLPAYSEGGYDV